MKVRFTRRAVQDLAAIADYIRAENPAAAERVRASILESLRIIADFPGIGAQQTQEGVRRHITRKYGYLVYYATDVLADEVAILTIRHPARERR